MSIRSRSLLMVAGGVLLLGVVALAAWQWQQHRENYRAETLAINNRGVAIMEQFDYGNAEVEFQKVVARDPDWLPGHINLAIAQLNQATVEKIYSAIRILQQVLAKDKDNPHAHFCLGYLLKYRSQIKEAIGHFEVVVRVDPTDAGSWYHLADCLGQLGEDADRTLDCLKKAHDLDPYLNAATLALQARLQQTDPEAAERMRQESELLRRVEMQTLTSDNYTEQGSKYGEVIGKPTLPTLLANPAPLPVFQAAENFAVKLAPNTRWANASDLGTGPIGDLRRAVRQRFGATIIRLDYNGDGKPDLFLIGAVVENNEVRDLLLRNDGNGAFTDVTRAAGLAGARPTLGCCAADFDNDGHLDLFVSGAGVQKLFRNKGDGTFEDVSANSGLEQLKSICLGCSWVDLDQDSDLDLIVARYADTPEQALAQLNGENFGPGGVAVFLNVGEALPAPIGTPSPGLTVKFQHYPKLEDDVGAKIPAVGFVVTDADVDHDVDLLVLEERRPITLAINDRLLRFRRVPLSLPDTGAAWNGALVLDLAHTERSDVVLLPAGQAPVLQRNRAVPGKHPTQLYEKAAINSPALKQAYVVDLDLDGRSDVLGLSDDGKPVFLQNDRAGQLVHRPDALGADAPERMLAILPGDFDGDGNPDVLLWSETAGLQLRRSLGNNNQCVKVQLWGRRDIKPKPALRTNNDGIGVRLALQTSRFWTGIENGTLSAGLGQSVAPLELGIGKATRRDVIVRLYWPDLVIQAEFCDVEKNKDIWRIEEKNRKTISCPILLTWDGEKFVYITDFLGEGSVGEMLATGGTRPARPEESVKIEAGKLKPRDGHYVLKIGEPMDEITYLDRLQLTVVDHPPGTEVFPDERFATGGKPPTQELLLFRERFFAQSARDHKGRDMTATLRERDGKMVNGFAHRSWMGFAEEHWTELDFGDQLKTVGANERLYLVLAGWTDYPYPESIFAANQAGVPMVPPVLERLGPDGKWVAIDEIGFPAGLPRVMTKDVTGLLVGHTGKLRIRTNLQIYWDQIYLARPVDTGAKVTALDVADANLAVRGFLRETHPDHTPLVSYDPDKTEPVPVTRWQGRFTKLGDVTELLKATDDRVVILAPGDEVTVRFDARNLPPLPAGWTRSLVLRTWGWCKDSAPFTATGGSVLPLPFRAMKQFPPGPEEKYPHPDDLKLWHTRRGP